MKKENTIVCYDIKVNRGNGFKYEGSEYLNYMDNEGTRDKKIDEIKEKYNIKKGEYLNISNFSDVYF